SRPVHAVCRARPATATVSPARCANRRSAAAPNAIIETRIAPSSVAARIVAVPNRPRAPSRATGSPIRLPVARTWRLTAASPAAGRIRPQRRRAAVEMQGAGHGGAVAISMRDAYLPSIPGFSRRFPPRRFWAPAGAVSRSWLGRRVPPARLRPRGLAADQLAVAVHDDQPAPADGDAGELAGPKQLVQLGAAYAGGAQKVGHGHRNPIRYLGVHIDPPS